MSSAAGTSKSVAPESTKNSASYVSLETKLFSLTATCVRPLLPTPCDDVFVVFINPSTKACSPQTKNARLYCRGMKGLKDLSRGTIRSQYGQLPTKHAR